MLDVRITGATIIDGTGTPGFTGDVGIRDGRIVAVGAAGSVTEAAARTIDGAGLVVAPGFVDPHTHYDAQLMWDPHATPSNLHGVTSVIAGNCGFTLAPIASADADFTRRMMAKVEGMPLAALEQGIDWKWNSFGEYLDILDGSIAVNAGFLVGHCAIRRQVMGAERAMEPATEAELAAMVQLLAECIDAGGLGFSTTRSSSHTDGDGDPVPSRMAGPDEVLALCREVGRHDGTTLEAITEGCNHLFTDAEIDLFVEMSRAAQRPLNWNVLTLDAAAPDRAPHQLQPSLRAAAAGDSKVVALTMPVLVPMNMNFLTYCALWNLPNWREVMALPVAERKVALSDPATQQRMLEGALSKEAGVFGRLANFGGYRIGDTYAPENDGLRGRIVDDIAAERGTDPFATLCAIVVADDLRTIVWPHPTDDNAESWELRRSMWENPHVMIGGSDAGAHLDRMFGAGYTTQFLADTIRGRRLVSLERAVQLITDVPARLFGLRDRGRVAAGMVADLVVFDPATIDAEQPTLVPDLPAASIRLTAGSHGIAHVFVNGVETVADGVATGARPGVVLRSGRDTETVGVA
jgi:N-acyl-D-aspartate/D-glutamate deacylase